MANLHSDPEVDFFYGGFCPKYLTWYPPVRWIINSPRVASINLWTTCGNFLGFRYKWQEKIDEFKAEDEQYTQN